MGRSIREEGHREQRQIQEPCSSMRTPPDQKKRTAVRGVGSLQGREVLWVYRAWGLGTEENEVFGGKTESLDVGVGTAKC